MKRKKIKAKNSEPKSKRCRDFDPALDKLREMSNERLADYSIHFGNLACEFHAKIESGLESVTDTLVSGLKKETKKHSWPRQKRLRDALLNHSALQESQVLKMAYAWARAELIDEERKRRDKVQTDKVKCHL